MIEMRGLEKTYGEGDTLVRALADINLTVNKGESVAIIGPSGSGKSTLMNIMGCLDQPTSGAYALDGVAVESLNDDELSRLRGSKIGFVFQSFNLLPQATATENVELPLLYADEHATREQTAAALLDELGLAERSSHMPGELSGGQQQRVAIARALMNDPSIILADEPTGALDTRSGLETMALFQRLSAAGRTIILVTHDRAIAEHAQRILTLNDGTIITDESVSSVLNAQDELAALPLEVQTQ